jgi:lipoate-protein ligase A
MDVWRLILDIPRHGAMNMAIDQAIMEDIGENRGLPTLRFYAWDPPCLSLGYAQSILDIDQERLREYGWDSVRRMTGGRAILHTNELTYSIAFPGNHPMVIGDILSSYCHLSSALSMGLTALGLPVEALPIEKTRQRSAAKAVCFEVPSHYEITIAGKKLVGSAQVRRSHAVLQHGTLPLYGDITRICDGLAFPDEATRLRTKTRVKERATTVEDILGRTITWEEAATQLTRAFAETFQVELQPETLTGAELQRAHQLAEELYAYLEWNKRP